VVFANCFHFYFIFLWLYSCVYFILRNSVSGYCMTNRLIYGTVGMTCLRNDLLSAEWDVKPFTHLFTSDTAVFWISINGTALRSRWHYLCVCSRQLAYDWPYVEPASVYRWLSVDESHSQRAGVCEALIAVGTQLPSFYAVSDSTGRCPCSIELYD